MKKKLTKATTLKFLQDKGIEKESIKIPKFHYFKIQSYKNKKKKLRS